MLEAVDSFKKAIEINPANDLIYATLEGVYIEMGDKRLAGEYNQKARGAGAGDYPLATVTNYHRLKAILDKRGIVYVCMQYPMRSVGPLKMIFRGDDKGIIFVDNEKIFKDAVAGEGYKKYFRDIFGGEFGHCSEEGNRLLAKHAAEVILKEVFGK
jgi:hypothetical protein